LPWVYRVGWH